MKRTYFKIMTLTALIAVTQVQAVEWNPSKWSCETAEGYVNTVVDYTNASINSLAPGVQYIWNGAGSAVSALGDGAMYVGKGLVSVLPQPAAKPVERRDIELAQHRAEKYRDKKELEGTKYRVAAKTAAREAEFIRVNVSRDIAEKTDAMSKACAVANEQSHCSKALADLQASVAFAQARVSDRNDAIEASHKAGQDYAKYAQKEKDYEATVAKNSLKSKQDALKRNQELLEQRVQWDNHLDRVALARGNEPLKKSTVINSMYECGRNYVASLSADMKKRQEYGEVFSLTTNDSITKTALTVGVVGLAVVARKTQLAKQAWYRSKAYVVPTKNTSVAKSGSPVETTLKAAGADNPSGVIPTQAAESAQVQQVGFFAQGKETFNRYFGA